MDTTYGLNGTRFFMRLAVLLALAASCASNKDVYRNPYQSDAYGTSATGPAVTVNVQTSQAQQPEWIYAVSKDFIVGYGSGNDVIEAKNAALNDIKAFIIKSLGEKGDVVEVNFVKNSVTGRNLAESQEVYLLKNRFENQYRPVIQISLDKVSDYYFEKSGSIAKYYIRYNIDTDELIQLKRDYLRSVQEAQVMAIRNKQIIDSLLNASGEMSIEFLSERYSGILNFLKSGQPDRNDSLRLVKGLVNIENLLNGIQIRIMEHVAGEKVIFSLVSGQTPVNTNCRPGIKYLGIATDSLKMRDEDWVLYYRTNSGLTAPGFIEVYYDLPFKRLTSRISVPVPVAKPLFEIAGQVNCTDFSKDFWNGRIKSLRVAMNIISNSDRIYMINDFELMLLVHSTIKPVLEADDFVLTIKPGLNRLTKIIRCDLPAPFFISQELKGDMTLYYSLGNKSDIFNLKNISLNIQNY